MVRKTTQKNSIQFLGLCLYPVPLNIEFTIKSKLHQFPLTERSLLLNLGLLPDMTFDRYLLRGEYAAKIIDNPTVSRIQTIRNPQDRRENSHNPLVHHGKIRKVFVPVIWPFPAVISGDRSDDIPLSRREGELL